LSYAPAHGDRERKGKRHQRQAEPEENYETTRSGSRRQGGGGGEPR